MQWWVDYHLVPKLRLGTELEAKLCFALPSKAWQAMAFPSKAWERDSKNVKFGEVQYSTIPYRNW